LEEGFIQIEIIGFNPGSLLGHVIKNNPTGGLQLEVPLKNCRATWTLGHKRFNLVATFGDRLMVKTISKR
jgi:hypothetical protein